MLVIATLDFAVAIREAVVEHYPQASPFWQPWLVPVLGGPAAVMIGWLAVVLLGLAGRRRAAAAIAGRRRACVMIAGLSGGYGFSGIVILMGHSAPLPDSVFNLLGVLAMAVAVVVTRVRGTIDWRVAVLAAPTFLLYAASLPLEGSLTATVVILLGSWLFAVLPWPVAIVSWRGRVKRASRAAGG